MKGKIIVARAVGHSDRRCGKWCQMSGERVFICDVDGRWMHQNSDSWPINAADLDAWSREVLIRYLLDEIQDGDPADAMRRFRKVVTVEEAR